MRRDKGFTLIELLVVISVIALLMAILMPALQRVKRQAKAVVCRSSLRQWGMWFSMYTQDNDDKFFGGVNPKTGYSDSRSMWPRAMQPYYMGSNDVLLCPMARKPNSPQGFTFSAWQRSLNYTNCTVRGSYGLNSAVRNDVDVAPGTLPNWHMPRWKTSLVKGANNVPVFLDSWRFRGDVVKSLMGMTGIDKPPAHEVSNTRGGGHFGFFCINRHDGGINGLFMDWSVRRVGLKELWTLKWQRNFNTAGPWTKAGGVRPEDWPEWMRKFKDY